MSGMGGGGDTDGMNFGLNYFDIKRDYTMGQSVLSRNKKRELSLVVARRVSLTSLLLPFLLRPYSALLCGVATPDYGAFSTGQLLA